MESTKNAKGSEFHVVLSGMKLSPKLENHIAAEIQRVVDSAIGSLPNPDDPDGNDGPAGGGHPHGPLGGNFSGYLTIPSKRWKGRWILALPNDFKINPALIDGQQKALQQGLQQQMG